MLGVGAGMVSGSGIAHADRVVDDSTGFASPSGNIYCIIDPSGVRCDIRDRDWSPPPRPANCPPVTGYGNGIEIVPGYPARFVCAGDTTYNQNALAYGDSITAGVLHCTSAESGMTCRDLQTGHGFTLARQAYDLF
jgi:hypothetical protein